MTNGHERVLDDRTPGVEEHESTASYLSYTVGLVLAILATIASFVVSQVVVARYQVPFNMAAARRLCMRS